MRATPNPQKLEQIPAEIKAIALNDPIVHRCLDAFMMGDIITREELYCRIIVMICHDWKAEQRAAYEATMATLNQPPTR